MRRRLLMFLILLGGGAIVNVAAAWTFAVWDPASSEFALQGDQSGWLWTPPADWPAAQRRLVLNSIGLSVTIVSANAVKPDSSPLIDKSFRQQAFDAGSPCRSVRMQSTKVRSMATQTEQVTWEGRLRLGTRNAADASSMLALEGVPLLPLWPGFAINTVFYAVVLWLLFAGPFVVRRWRRIRRGLCPKCAYDLRGSPESAACPECGAAF